MISNILSSVTKTVAVSSVITALAYYGLQLPILPTFIITTLCQIAFFYLWNTVLEYRLRRVEIENETLRIQSYSEQGAEVPCAHCNKQNYIPIRMDVDNIFTCDECGKSNAVYVDLTVAQQSQPMSRETLSVTSYIKDKIDATEQIQQG